MPGFDDTNSKGEAGAVVLRAGSTYLTVGSVPSPESLEVLRVEKIRTEWLHGDLETGDTIQLPLTYTKAGSQQGSQPLALHSEQTEPLSARAREVWQSYERDGLSTYQSLRKVCSERGLNPGANPSTEEMVDALMDAQAVPPAPSSSNNVSLIIQPATKQQPVQYSPAQLFDGIEEADGPAAAEAMSILEGQVSQYLKKREVVDDYLSIADDASQFDEVRDVADAHGVHWRTVHRYAQDLLTEEERILTPTQQ